MDQYLLFAIIGLGFGVIYAAVGMGLVITYRGTGIINFGIGAMGVWSAYVYDELGRTGDLVFPVAIIPHKVRLADDVSFLLAVVVGIASSILVGLAVYFLVFRPLRHAPILARVVASVGVLITMQAMVVIRFESAPRSVPTIVPDETIRIGGADVPRDRLWLTLVVVAVAVVMWAYFRFTRLGLATRAAAENEQAIALARFSPQVLAGSSIVLSSVIVGTMAILTAPTFVLNPITMTLVVVPALAAALVGRLNSVAVAVAAGLALGSVQSVLGFLTSKSWWPTWAVTGLTDAVPFLVIVAALFLFGRSLPVRGEGATARLPDVIRPRNRWQVIAALMAAGVVALVVTSGSYRFGLITSMIVAMIALSLVVLTGLVGQISLAQAAIAGSAGFALSKLADDANIPFPLSPLLAALVATVLGVLVGVPALRIRGAQLAVVTLAAAVTLERFVFRNPNISNTTGNLIPDPSLFGVDLGVREGTNIARLSFGLLVLVVLGLAAIAVANIARSATGRRFLAVRSNERAGAAVGISIANQKLIAFAMSSFLAGVGGVFIGYSRGQLSAGSFTTLVGLSFLAFAYLGGITSVSGALVAGMFAPLGIAFVFVDRNLDLGPWYLLLSGVGLISTAIFNPEGIAGATRDSVARQRRRIRPPADEVVSEPPAPATEHPVGQRAARAPGPVLLATDDLCVSYGGLRAVDRLNVEVHAGQIVGLIGPNGAGKTTTIDALTGFTSAAGAVRFLGDPIGDLTPHARARRGLVRTWQSIEIFDDLTVAENLRVARERASVGSVLLDIVHPVRHTDDTDVEWALELIGLTHYADARPSTLSLGQKKLLGVARALAAGPKVVLLDEPAAGLDSAESQALGERLLDVVEHGIAILLVDHDMGLVLNVCDEIYVLDFGRVLAHGTASEIRDNDDVIAAYLGEEARAAKAARTAPTTSTAASVEEVSR